MICHVKDKGVSLETALDCCISYLSDRAAENKNGNGIDLQHSLEFLRHCQYNESASLKGIIINWCNIFNFKYFFFFFGNLDWPVCVAT